MATLSARTTVSAPDMAEDVVLSISHLVGEFGVEFGGENASGERSDGWLTIARYGPHDGKPGEGMLIPFSVDQGVAELGVLTTAQLRDIAQALTRAADRYDALQAAIRGNITPIARARRRA